MRTPGRLQEGALRGKEQSCTCSSTRESVIRAVEPGTRMFDGEIQRVSNELASRQDGLPEARKREIDGIDG